MQLKPLGSNQTELRLTNGTTVLFSYETPVACYSNDDGKYYRTNKQWSRTTSKHINKWLESISAVSIDQIELESIIKLNEGV